MRQCALHLPGNLQCPYPALFWLSALVLEMNPPLVNGRPEYRTLGREVCSNHLEAGILVTLDHAPASEHAVQVGLIR